MAKVRKEDLEEFLRHRCDGFQDILVESEEPLVLIFVDWGGTKYRLVVESLEILPEETVWERMRSLPEDKFAELLRRANERVIKPVGGRARCPGCGELFDETRGIKIHWSRRRECWDAFERARERALEELLAEEGVR